MSSLPTPKQVYLLSLVYEKSVEPVLSLVPRIWALALPCLSKRATLIQRQYNAKSHATFKMIIKRA